MIKTLTIVLCLFSQFVQAQDSLKLLVVTNKNATINIDGVEMAPTIKNVPQVYSVTTGEHYVQAKCRCPKAEVKFEIVDMTGSSQKVVNFNFDETIELTSQALQVGEYDFSLPGVLSKSSDNPPTDPVHYFAFDASDEISLDLTMSNAKGSNNLIVFSYPDNRVIYTKNNFQALQKTALKIPKRGIYGFSFSTNHAFARSVHLKVSRTPASIEAKPFDTHVSWQEVYHTKVVQRPQSFYINGGVKSTWGTGKSRVIIPINLPANTVKWYYEFTAERGDEAAHVENKLSLASELSLLVDQTGVLAFGIDQLTKPPGADYCDVYLLDHDNSSRFRSKTEFRYFTDGTRENLKSGIVELNYIWDIPVYLGIKNPADWYGLNVGIEVVAIVKERKLVMFN